jgi:signal transduction histidine kinase
MTSLLSLIFTFLTAPPGNLIYHLVLVFSIAGALQAAIHNLRTGGGTQLKRTVFGLSLLLGFQLFLFLVSALCWRGLLNTSVLLPPLDRAVSFLSLVWIAWLWAFPEPVRYADAASILVSLLGMALFILSVSLNTHAVPGEFNTSRLEFIWQGFSLAMVLLGFLGLALRRPNGWGNGLAMLILAFLGHLASLMWRVPGDYPGILRLAHLAMFPILLTLAQRFPASVKEERRKKEPPAKKVEAPPWQERRRYSTDPKTFQSLINLAAVNTGEKIGVSLTRAIAQAMLADLCFLVSMAEDKSLAIVCGYDLIREESLGGTAVGKDTIPLLANAIQRARPLRMAASATSTDMKGLGKVLGLATVGHLLFVPVASPERGPMAGILILSPYSNRQWNAEDQVYLSNVSSLILPVLERGERIAALELERDNAQIDARAAQEELAVFKSRVEESGKDAQASSELNAQLKLQAESLAAAAVAHEEAQKTIEQLRSENETLRAASAAPSANTEQVEEELRQSLEDMARLQNTLTESNQKLMELEARPEVPITNEQVEVIASISQELRQPMSSIVGYTDLLLGESVGILGALQRKFVERVKASTERIGGLIEDLIQITNLDTGHFEFKPEMIDLNLIIDNAMAYTSTVIREKNITLRLDIPENPPDMMTDRDALQQVLIHLLQNATAVTQVEGTITLRVQMKEEEEQSYLAIHVTDTGGGIASEDIPRVFARRYRAEHSLIQGVGDTGVGLSIAKTLVEAQNGRIWVETEANVGSTFSILLPVLPVELEE